MSTTPSPCIVVGYDGSPAAEAALRLAADRAGSSGLVYVVHAFDAPADFWGTPRHDAMLHSATEHGRALLERLASDSDALAGVHWDTELLAGPPAEAIARVAAAREADEIILGSRGFGRVRALLGSVAHEVLHLAGCPVTVIPEQVADREASRQPHASATP